MRLCGHVGPNGRTCSDVAGHIGMHTARHSGGGTAWNRDEDTQQAGGSQAQQAADESAQQNLASRGCRGCTGDGKHHDAWCQEARVLEQLRDRFAMAALTGILTGELRDACTTIADTTGQEPQDVQCRVAYEYADAMLAARSAPGAKEQK